MRTDDVRKVREAAAALGVTARLVLPIVGDASRRSFYRVVTPEGTVVAAVYPDGAEPQVERDELVHAWGWERSLPIPRPIGRTALVALSEDLGDEDLDTALRRRGESVLAGAVEALAAFQQCGFQDLVTSPFDAVFFRRELEVFEQFAHPDGGRTDAVVTGFLDDLCSRLAAHPLRLVHRDFHVNNLFLRAGSVAAVDYQDMRGGPDTYDLASLLRERGGGERVGNSDAWPQRAARRLRWQAGWERRYLECAAQRGLKVIGTFLRLASWGRTEYLAWLPRVRELTREAVVALDGPGALVARL